MMTSNMDRNQFQLWTIEATKELQRYGKSSISDTTPYLRNILKGADHQQKLSPDFLQRNNKENQQPSNLNSIADLMSPMLVCLSFVGHYPIFKEPQYPLVSNKQQAWTQSIPVTNFRTTWKSKKAPVFLIAAICSVLSLGALLSDFVIWIRTGSNAFGLSIFFESFSSNSTTYGRYSTPAVRKATYFQCFLIPGMLLVETVCSWLESPRLPQLLNNWQEYQSEFLQSFPNVKLWNSGMTRIRKFRNKMLICFVAIPAAFIFPVFLAFVYIRKFEGFSIFFVIMAMGTSLISSLMKDANLDTTFRTLSVSFEQIRNGISYSVQFDKITADKAKQWRKLVYMIKTQAALVGQLKKNAELFLIAATILIITALIYVGLNGPWQYAENIVVLVIFIGFSVFLFLRLYLKVLAAHEISIAEASIARELAYITIPGDDEDTSAQIEIKFLYDMIMDAPTKINFGNYVTLNKSLILGIASQIVTYLIVIMQFTQ